MNKREAKIYVESCCKTILENGLNDFLCEVPEKDVSKVQDAFQKLLNELSHPREKVNIIYNKINLDLSIENGEDLD